MSNDEFGDPTRNPYEAAPLAPVAVSGNKPASLTVFGILNLVFGVMGLCGAAVFVIQMAVMDEQPNIENPMIELTQTPIYHGFTIAQMGLGFIASIVLMISGIGLLNSKPYGRTLSIGWAIYSIFATIVGIVFSAIFIMMPLIERADAADGPEQAAFLAGGIGATVGGLCGLIYPILLLLFMMRGPIVTYLRGQQAAAT